MINLTGYTSTSLNLDVAKEFAFSDLEEDKVAVIYNIVFNDDEGLFSMNDRRFTAFEEEEVLLQDGLEYRIVSIEEKEDQDLNIPYVNITLIYPSNSNKANLSERSNRNEEVYT